MEFCNHSIAAALISSCKIAFVIAVAMQLELKMTSDEVWSMLATSAFTLPHTSRDMSQTSVQQILKRIEAAQACLSFDQFYHFLLMLLLIYLTTSQDFQLGKQHCGNYHLQHSVDYITTSRTCYLDLGYNVGVKLEASGLNMYEKAVRGCKSLVNFVLTMNK